MPRDHRPTVRKAHWKPGHNWVVEITFGWYLSPDEVAVDEPVLWGTFPGKAKAETWVQNSIEGGFFNRPVLSVRILPIYRTTDYTRS